MMFARGIVLLVAALLSGCITTTKCGEYVVRVRSAAGSGVEVSGQLNASAFVDWSKTRYGEEPRTLVLMVIASLLPSAVPESYEVTDIRFTRYEAGNYIGWGALVTGSDETLQGLKSKIGKQVEGDFSFEDSRLLQVRGERISPP